jgi:hypothetical protein
MPMAGYYATRLATGTHDDLHAKAIVIESGGQKAALVACDLVSIPPAVVVEARRLAKLRTSIPEGNIMISATHSHTGPLLNAGGTREKAFGAELDVAKQYMRDLPQKVAESIISANATLEPAKISFGRGKEESISFNRRFFMKDGTVAWNAGKLNPNIVKPAGPIDPEVGVIYFESTSGKPLATYVNFALHLDTTGGMEFSADYPLALSRVLGKVKSEDMLTLFTIGAAGNINHINVKDKAPQKGFQEAERIGTVLAGEVIKTYTRLQPVDGGKLIANSQFLKLQPASIDQADTERAEAFKRRFDSGEKMKFLDTVYTFKVLDTAARQNKPFDAEVQVIVLGGKIAWVGLPGEVFTELGSAIKQASPFPMTIVAELAHGPVTYYPNEVAFDQGNYEVVTARTEKGSGEKFVEAAKQLLNQIYSETSGH